MDVELTELEKLEVTRVDAVTRPANGFPVLLMKGVAAKGARDCPKCDKSYDADHQGGKCENCGTDLPDAPASKAADDAVDCPTCKGDGKIMGDKRDCPDCDAKGKVSPAKAKTLAAKSLARGIITKAVGADGEVDEEPDVKGGTDVLAMIADLIISEAQELKAGQAGEIADLFELCCAAEKIWCWRTGEEAVSTGSVMPATALMQSAAKSGPSAEDRRQAAAEGNALSDGSYPIRNEKELHAAAILAQSGHGDVAAAKKLIARRAKELGVANPLDDGDDTSKSQIAEGGTDVDTVTQGTGDLEKAVEAAVTKALAASEERVNALEAELAKVMKLPVPGGPMMTRVQQPKAEDGEDHAAKAVRYDTIAEQLADPTTADEYRKLAAQHRAKITV